MIGSPFSLQDSIIEHLRCSVILSHSLSENRDVARTFFTVLNAILRVWRDSVQSAFMCFPFQTSSVLFLFHASTDPNFAAFLHHHGRKLFFSENTGTEIEIILWQIYPCDVLKGGSCRVMYNIETLRKVCEPLTKLPSVFKTRLAFVSLTQGSHSTIACWGAPKPLLDFSQFDGSSILPAQEQCIRQLQEAAPNYKYSNKALTFGSTHFEQFSDDLASEVKNNKHFKGLNSFWKL